MVSSTLAMACSSTGIVVRPLHRAMRATRIRASAMEPLGRYSILAGLGFVAITVAATSLAGNEDPRMYERRGMDKFRKNDIAGAMADFDKVIDIQPTAKPYLWQRGICLYYLNRFEEGASQFREDLKVNPGDSEETIWCFLCESRAYGVAEARTRMLTVGDRRPYMQRIQELMKGGGDPNKIVDGLEGKDEQYRFYCTLYAGLYYEVQGMEKLAKNAILSAAATPYSSRGDYMTYVAKVHCKVRGWEKSP